MQERVSILIATHRRPRLLRDTLGSIAAAAGSRPVEVVVADNADDPATAQVCEAVDGLRVTYFVAKRPGKNAALNRAVERAGGDLLLFTDDDVLVDASWIDAMAEAAGAWPDHEIFGGRVLPRWPCPPPPHLGKCRYSGVCFSILDPALPEGPLEGFRPFGPNLAMKRRVFDDGHRYNEAIGPNGTSYVMGNETEFVRRLAGERPCPVFVSRSVVHHRIHQHELAFSTLLRRGVRYGRQLAYLARTLPDEPAASPSTRLRLHYVKEAAQHAAASLRSLTRGDRRRAFERSMDAAVAVGSFQQWLRDPEVPGPPTPESRNHPALH